MRGDPNEPLPPKFQRPPNIPEVEAAKGSLVRLGERVVTHYLPDLDREGEDNRTACGIAFQPARVGQRTPFVATNVWSQVTCRVCKSTKK